MVVLMLGATTVAALAQYQLRTEVNPDGTLTVSQGAACPNGALVIPGVIDGRNVTRLGGGGFQECTDLTSVTIPDSVTGIGDGAFEGCAGLTNITIPDSVTSIGNNAFSWCTRLASVTIPDSVTSLGGGTFSGCTSLVSVTIPGSVIKWADGGDWGPFSPYGTFQGCMSLNSVTIDHGVTRIVSRAFSDCTALPKLTIPKSVTSIGPSAFSGCTGLTNITVPDSVTTIGEWAFKGCTALGTVYFGGDCPLVVGRNEEPNEGWAFMEPTVAFFLPGSQRWTSAFSGRPTAPWVRPNPTILDFGDRFGPTTNGFSFVISWATNVPVVVEASAELGGAGWTPISTNTLTDGWVQFVDSDWKSQTARFYRVRAQ